MQEELIFFQEKLFSIYPRFYKYLKLNNEISARIFDIYDSEIVPKELNTIKKINKDESIGLASKIISIISPSLKEIYIEEKIKKIGEL